MARSSELISKMRSGLFAPIYTLMGEQGYFIDKVAQYVVAHALPAEQQDFNQIILYGKDVRGSDVVAQCRRYPVMSERQVVIVREAQSMLGFEALEGYAKNPMATTVLVLCYKGKSLDRRLTITKALEKGGEVLESVSARDYEVERYIGDMLSERHLTAEAKAVAMLGQCVGTNISKLDNELTKMLTRLPQQTTHITAQHVEQNVGISKDFNVFELTKALSAGDFRTALIIADYFANNPKDNPLVVTISMLFTHFQRIVTLNILLWDARRRGVAPEGDAEIARALKLPSAFFVGEYRGAVRHYPNAKAFAILGLLREYDCKSKGIGGTMSATDGELLRELILRMAAA